MGRSTCCDENGLKKGAWTAEEDEKLVEYMEKCGGDGNHHQRSGISWRQVPKLAGLKRCGKSCRLRWTNYLRPDIKRGSFSHEEEQTIINLHKLLGNKWSAIASNLPGRTDNEIKNFWNTHIKKKLLQMGIDPVTHTPLTTTHHDHLSTIAATTSFTPCDWALLQYLNSKIQVLQNNILQGQALLIGKNTASNAYAQHILCMLGMEMEAAANNYYTYVLGSSPSSSSSFPDQQLLYHHDCNCFQDTSFGNTSEYEYDHHDSKFAVPTMKATSSTHGQGGVHDHQLPILVSAATSPFTSSTCDTTVNDQFVTPNIHHLFSNSIHSSTNTATSTATFQIDHKVACDGRDLIVMDDQHHQEATNAWHIGGYGEWPIKIV